MPFTPTERESFVSALLEQDWKLEGETVSSTSGALWFDETHWATWSPQEMRDTFYERAQRIGEAMIGDDWESALMENSQVYKVLDAVLASLPASGN
tara:strand:+ start:3716 stop:4003 length:288 start_codon:yes stop_codon:yes gene_type:complete